MPQILNSPDFKHRLLSVKAYLDYQDEHTVRVNFLDTLRPELWCIDGLARHLEPSSGRSYGMHLVESLPRIPVQFKSLPPDTHAWVLYVQVRPDQEPLDDAYFLKKVRDQIGFGSFHNINVTLLPGRQHTLSIETPPDDDDVINRRGLVHHRVGGIGVLDATGADRLESLLGIGSAAPGRIRWKFHDAQNRAVLRRLEPNRACGGVRIASVARGRTRGLP